MDDAFSDTSSDSDGLILERLPHAVSGYQLLGGGKRARETRINEMLNTLRTFEGTHRERPEGPLPRQTAGTAQEQQLGKLVNNVSQRQGTLSEAQRATFNSLVGREDCKLQKNMQTLNELRNFIEKYKHRPEGPLPHKRAGTVRGRRLCKWVDNVSQDHVELSDAEGATFASLVNREECKRHRDMQTWNDLGIFFYEYKDRPEGPLPHQKAGTAEEQRLGQWVAHVSRDPERLTLEYRPLFDTLVAQGRGMQQQVRLALWEKRFQCFKQYCLEVRWPCKHALDTDEARHRNW